MHYVRRQPKQLLQMAAEVQGSPILLGRIGLAVEFFEPFLTADEVGIEKHKIYDN